jgi:hypothetical protein
MKSAAPLPDLVDLAAALASAPDDDVLAQPWRHGNEAAFWFSRGAWAMRALVDAWKSTHDQTAPAFWLPDYFCNQSTAPIRDAGARLIFYPIGDDLEPNWPACEGLADAEAPHIFVLVHYFGRPADTASAQDFCRRVGAWLVEDAAHAVGPDPAIGAVGDAVFYSPHKILAVPDGGLLLVRNQEIAAPLAAAVADHFSAAPPAALWLAKRLVQKILPTSFARTVIAGRGPAFADDPSFAPLPMTTAPSALARRLLARQGLALDAIARGRRQHGEALAEIVAGWPGASLLFADLPSGPYRLPVRSSDAPALYAALRGRGVPVETWPDLAPEVTSAPDDHVVALALRRSVLLLPVHAALRPRQIAAQGLG